MFNVSIHNYQCHSTATATASRQYGMRSSVLRTKVAENNVSVERRLKRLNRNSRDSILLTLPLSFTANFRSVIGTVFFPSLLSSLSVCVVWTRRWLQIHFTREQSSCLIYVNPKVHIFTTFYRRKGILSVVDFLFGLSVSIHASPSVEMCLFSNISLCGSYECRYVCNKAYTTYYLLNR